jgi:hypothetical protein
MSKPSINQRTRCTHRTSDSRRCQSSRAPNHKTLCAQHALQDLQLQNSKLVTEEIVGPEGDFYSVFAINRSLAKLFGATADNRIPARTATALAYISQLIMQTLHPLRREIINAVDSPEVDLINRDLFREVRLKLGLAPHGPREEGDVPSPDEIEESLAILRRAGFIIEESTPASAEESGERQPQASGLANAET